MLIKGIQVISQYNLTLSRVKRRKKKSIEMRLHGASLKFLKNIKKKFFFKIIKKIK